LHAASLGLAEDTLRAAFGKGFWVRTQRPLDLGIMMEPEPDIAVVKGTPRDYSGQHPTTALLIVEVSETTLAFDRGRKASIYAAAGIQDYWILNLIDTNLEVCRAPMPNASEPQGFGYSSRIVVPATGRVSPLSAPQIEILVSDMLP
jgi:Uma2 family endonuclease